MDMIEKKTAALATLRRADAEWLKAEQECDGTDAAHDRAWYAHSEYRVALEGAYRAGATDDEVEAILCLDWESFIVD